MLVDCHSDIAIDIHRRRRAGERRVLLRRHLSRLKRGSITAAVCTVGGDSPGLQPCGPSQPYAGARALLGALEDDVAEASDVIAIARSADEVHALSGENKFALVLALEGGSPLEGNLDRLEEFWQRGVRVVGLTWNTTNELGAGTNGGDGGLTALGAAAVERMAEHGILLDLAHASPATFWGALSVTTKPAIVSHANAAALHRHPRNLDDEQAVAIAATGGLVAISAYPAFVGPGRTTIDDVVGHIMHLVDLLGPRHVGIGADFVEYLQDHRNIEFPDGLADCTTLGRLPALLRSRGLTPAAVKEISGQAFLRVLATVTG